MKLLLLLFLVFHQTSPYKVLFVIPKWMYSHMNFIGNIADILVEGGHDVTMLQPVVVPTPGNGTKLAKVIDFQPGPEVFESLVKSEKEGTISKIWTTNIKSSSSIMFSVKMIGEVSYLNTKAMLSDEGFLKRLRDEQFDIGITELFDFSGVALFHAIGLKNVIGAHSTSALEGTLMSTGAPILPSYIPASQTSTGSEVGLFNRLWNMCKTYWSWRFQKDIASYAQKAVTEKLGKGHDIWKMVDEITWFLVNSDPIFDFPKAIPTNIVEIQGIGSPKVKPLDEYWNEVLSRRPKNVLVSFGSIANPKTMPDAYRKSIFQAFASLPDVTFIWKFEQEDDPLLKDAPNVVITKWMPQNDLLADSRITAFLTHAGVGSLLESLQKGVPLIVVPIFGDQPRNAQIARHHGTAVIFDKTELGNAPKLLAAIKEVLENTQYKTNAVLLSQLFAAKWSDPKEKILKTIEFAGKFGQMPRFKSNGRHLGLLAYFNLDIVLIFLSIVTVFVILIATIVRRFCFSAKEKTD